MFGAEEWGGGESPGNWRDLDGEERETWVTRRVVSRRYQCFIHHVITIIIS